MAFQNWMGHLKEGNGSQKINPPPPPIWANQTEDESTHREVNFKEVSGGTSPPTSSILQLWTQRRLSPPSWALALGFQWS